MPGFRHHRDFRPRPRGVGEEMIHATGPVTRIAVVGDFEPGRTSHTATNEALRHAANCSQLVVDVEWVATPTLEEEAGLAGLEGFQGIFCAPGGYKSTVGALDAIRFARERGWPFLGT